jgi:hypothetical protein
VAVLPRDRGCGGGAGAGRAGEGVGKRVILIFEWFGDITMKT